MKTSASTSNCVSPNVLEMSSNYDAIAWVYHRYWGPFSVKRFMPVLERLLLPHLPKEAQILDLGCGTGNLARALWEKGYRVTGVDVSAGMLREAREVAPEVKFVQQDMRFFKRSNSFHAVIALFATMNHLVSEEDLQRVLENVKESLVGDGWLVFDFNTASGLSRRWQGGEAVVEEDMVLISQGQYDENAEIATSTITAFRPQGRLWLRSDAEIRLRGYDEEKMKELLGFMGFDEVAMHRFVGKAGQGRVFAVARKPVCT